MHTKLGQPTTVWLR